MTGLKKLLMWKASGGAGPVTPLVEATASGNPATFVTDVARPLKSCTVPISYTQSGSGDPTPTNVRQISGRTGLSVYVSPTSSGGTEYPVSWQTDAGTVYGGTIDLVSGILTITHRYLDVNSTNLPSLRKYGVESGAWLAQFRLDENSQPLGVAASCISNRFTQKISKGPGRVNLASNNINLYFFLPEDEVAGGTIEGAWLWFEEHPTQLIYTLVTPQTVQINPKNIRAILGENNVWSDPSGTIELTYLKKA